MKYRVIQITKDIERYPECLLDTEEFPQLVKYVDSGKGLFIVDESGRCVAPAGDFFYTHNITSFVTGVKQCDDTCICGGCCYSL